MVFFVKKIVFKFELFDSLKTGYMEPVLHLSVPNIS
jgi:hypothetical protein